VQGVELLNQGIMWCIGDGQSANIWADPWLPRGKTRQPACPGGGSLLTRVFELLNSNIGA
jgi:hypothetical protein